MPLLSEPFRQAVESDAVSVFGDDQAKTIVGFGCAVIVRTVCEVFSLVLVEVFCGLAPFDPFFDEPDCGLPTVAGPLICSLNAVVCTHLFCLLLDLRSDRHRNFMERQLLFPFTMPV